MKEKYLGHSSQMSGVEEVTLARGKGKGMTLLEVRNGCGLRLVLSADRGPWTLPVWNWEVSTWASLRPAAMWRLLIMREKGTDF